MVSGPFGEIGVGSKPYIDQIVRTAKSIMEIRDSSTSSFGDAAFGETLDLNLFSPSIFPHVFSNELSPNLDREERHRFVVARRLLEKQTGYSFSVQTPAQIAVIVGNRETAERTGLVNSHPLFRLRAEELGLSTECVSALAVSELSPVLRLPNDVNRTSGSVRNFAATYRSAAPSSRKRTQGFHDVQTQLANAFPADFLEMVKASQTGIRIISDAHLEWLDLDGLPLLLRKSVTRIPTTPGNLFIQNLAA